jgi:murein DD-endopeptidase MepM/ murein hydrolase activator NlpD
MTKRKALGFIAVAVFAATTPAFADKLTEAKHKAEQLQQQQKTTKKKIASLKDQEQSLKYQISNIQNQLAVLQKNVLATEVELQRRNAAIKKLERQIQQTEQKIHAQYGVLSQRVRVMYESGHTTFLDVLFSSSSFADFLSRLQLLTMIANQDKQVLDSIKANKQRLAASRANLVSQQAQQKAVYAELVRRQNEQEAAEHRERTLLAQVHDTRIREEAQLQDENSALQGLQSLIQQLEQQSGSSYSGPSDGWVWPVPGYHTISSGYGWRTWGDGHREFHNGIDIPAPVGTPIVAATGGKVLYAGPASGFGDWIVIQSAGGLIEIYGHMYSWEIKVSPGDIVRAGQQIAGVGSNGMSTGPHLHFTIATGFDSSGFPTTVSPLNYVHP